MTEELEGKLREEKRLMAEIDAMSIPDNQKVVTNEFSYLPLNGSSYDYYRNCTFIDHILRTYFRFHTTEIHGDQLPTGKKCYLIYGENQIRFASDEYWRGNGASSEMHIFIGDEKSIIDHTAEVARKDRLSSIKKTLREEARLRIWGHR